MKKSSTRDTLEKTLDDYFPCNLLHLYTTGSKSMYNLRRAFDPKTEQIGYLHIIWNPLNNIRYATCESILAICQVAEFKRKIETPCTRHNPKKWKSVTNVIL